MKKYKCIKCNRIVDSKEVEPKFKTDSNNKIETEIDIKSQERLIYQQIHKECGGPVIKINPETESRCNELYKRWEELKGKLPKAQISSIKGQYKLPDISLEERKEFDNIKKRLKEECLEFLNDEDRFDIK